LECGYERLWFIEKHVRCDELKAMMTEEVQPVERMDATVLKWHAERTHETWRAAGQPLIAQNFPEKLREESEIRCLRLQDRQQWLHGNDFKLLKKLHKETLRGASKQSSRASAVTPARQGPAPNH